MPANIRNRIPAGAVLTASIGPGTSGTGGSGACGPLSSGIAAVPATLVGKVAAFSPSVASEGSSCGRGEFAAALPSGRATEGSAFRGGTEAVAWPFLLIAGNTHT